MGRSRVGSFQLIGLILLQVFIFTSSPVSACDFRREPHNVLKIYDTNGKKISDNKLDYAGIGGSCEITNKLFALDDNAFLIEENSEELTKYSLASGNLKKQATQINFEKPLWNYFYADEELGMSYQELWSGSGPNITGSDFKLNISIDKFGSNDHENLQFNFADLLLSSVNNDTYYEIINHSEYYRTTIVQATHEYVVSGFEFIFTNDTRYFWVQRYELLSGNSIIISFTGDYDALSRKNFKISSDGRFGVVLVEYPGELFYLVDFEEQDIEAVTLPGTTKWEGSDVLGHDLYFMSSDSEKSVRKLNMEDEVLTELGDFGITGRFVVLDDYYLFINTETSGSFPIFGFGFNLLVASFIFLTIFANRRK